MQEVWKDIDGYEGKYQVSNLGRVKSLNYNRTGEEKLLKPLENKCGYVRVVLYKDRRAKNYLIHRLVAETFIPNPNNYPIINHKDENKQNNKVKNLEWCTYEYNNTYGSTIERAVEKRKGYKHTDEIRRKISESNKGKKYSEETINKMRKSKLGPNNPMYGMTGNKNPMYGRRGSKKPNAIKVICITTGEIFNSIKETELKLKICHIVDCCRGKRNYAGKHPVTGEKLVWRYYDE